MAADGTTERACSIGQLDINHCAMNETAKGLCLCLFAYLAGAMPFGLLTARIVRGIDIRQHGSGNIGATNVGRVLGSKWGLFVLVLDLLKGLLPVLLLSPLFISTDSNQFSNWRVAAGLATILGHMFPCWLWFRGGKGVATALGVALALSWLSTLVAFVVFVASFAIWRYVSLGSILGAIAYAICETCLGWPAPFATERLGLAIFSFLAPLLIIIRHRSNIGRLLRGEEPKYKSARGGEPTKAQDQQP